MKDLEDEKEHFRRMLARGFVGLLWWFKELAYWDEIGRGGRHIDYFSTN